MKKLLSIALSIIALSGYIKAYADNAEKNIDVFTDYVNVRIDDEDKSVRNFLTEEDTTYIALRDVAEILNCTVEWNDETKTAVITTNKPSGGTNTEAKAESQKKTITVLEDYVNVTIDGEAKTVRNFLSNETTYIALRDVSELLGCKVDWEDSTKTAVIRTGQEVALTVNGKPVSLVDFCNMYYDMKNLYRDMTQEMLFDNCCKQFAYRIIIDEKADEYNVRETAWVQAEAELREVYELNGKEQVDRYLESYGYTPEEYVKEIADSLTVSNVFQYMHYNLSEYKTAEDRAKEYYNAHKEEYKQHCAQVKHILIPVTAEMSDKEALAKAKEIARKATPENFDSLIAENDNDPGQQDEGYFVTEDTNFVPEFKEMALKLEKNEISEPVKTSYGYHIIIATEVYDYLPYESFYADYILEEWQKIDLQYVNEWIDSADIVINKDIAELAVELTESNID